jgi:hypothetical protein
MTEFKLNLSIISINVNAIDLLLKSNSGKMKDEPEALVVLES